MAFAFAVFRMKILRVCPAVLVFVFGFALSFILIESRMLLLRKSFMKVIPIVKLKGKPQLIPLGAPQAKPTLDSVLASIPQNFEQLIFEDNPLLVDADEDPLPALRCKRLEAFKVTALPGTNRTIISAVITRRRSTPSLKFFKAEWKKAWPDLDPRVATTYVDHSTMKGISTLAILYSSMVEALRCATDFTYFLVFKDSTLPADDVEFPGHLSSVLEEFDKLNGTGLLLGGEFWDLNQSSLICKSGRCNSTLSPINVPFSFDAIIFPKVAMSHVARRLEEALSKITHADMGKISVDFLQWCLWRDFRAGGFVPRDFLVKKREIHQAKSSPWNLRIRGERCDKIQAFKRTKSSASNRTFIAGVITLRAAPKHRVASFRKGWRRAWPDLEPTWFYTWRNPLSKRGLANMAGHYRIAVEALRCGGEFDYLLLFEDDGLPFEKAKFPEDLDVLLDTFDANDGSGLNLGGHDVSGYDEQDLMQWILPSRVGAIRAAQVFGSYAMLVPRKHLASFAARFERGLKAGRGEYLVPDKQNWACWRRNGGGGFVAAPLLVDHKPQTAYSFTWHKNSIRKYEGLREFWPAALEAKYGLAMLQQHQNLKPKQYNGE